MKAKTYQKGATDERSVILSKIKRLKKDFPYDAIVALSDLETWLKDRVKRFDKKPGGMSSKRKAKAKPSIAV